MFESCESVDYVYKAHEMRDFIFDAKHDDAKLICERMYDSEDFIYKKVSYADAWRKACNIPLKGNKTGSDTHANLNPSKFFPNFKTQANDFMKEFKKYINSKATCYANDEEYDEVPDDLKKFAYFIDGAKEEYDIQYENHAV